MKLMLNSRGSEEMMGFGARCNYFGMDRNGSISK